MKSTGEVMGISRTFPEAYAKTREAIEYEMPGEGAVFISVCDRDKRAIAPVALAIRAMGYDIVATAGTAQTLRAAGIDAKVVRRVSEGHPNVVDLMREGNVGFVINTPHGHESRGDGAVVRGEAVNRGICCVTALSATTALVQAIDSTRRRSLSAWALQDLPG
jgi:carbamoyl-phosphate synthase large subunit